MATTIDINQISGELFKLWMESFGIPLADVETHPITLALWNSGIRDFYTDFTVMSTEDIKELKYIMLNPNTTNLEEASLSTVQRRLICVVLSAWHHESRKIGAPLHLNKFTKDLIDEHRVSSYNPEVNILPWHAPSERTKNFKKSVKISSSDYAELRQDVNFNRWSYKWNLTATYHGLDKTLDENYIPTPADEEEFRTQQCYMYKLLSDKAKTPMAQSIIRKHADKQEVGKIWKELTDHYASTVITQAHASKLSTILTSARFKNSGWTGTTTEYVVWYKDQADQLREISEFAYTDDQLVQMLEQAFIGTSMAQVRNSIMVTRRATGSNAKLTFDEYVALLVEHASLEDINRGAERQALTTNVHDMHSGDTYEYKDDSIEVNCTGVRRNPRRNT